ncbi:type II secretion system protein E [Methylobacterium sp. 4-46]|uniref:GspE/PulE family protein n=1 Tax=unclassified Methylobacterium TaxID=2615210 RepID=UPI000152E531|nr:MULTISPECIES: GspE/PulE family protein [Methylobacterium]ACA16492.1 type II secretion system protein E [Methylobacterium sp. 4-46]WFT82202.1 GspE/PulE family protein [Methylobacterium nodulans]
MGAFERSVTGEALPPEAGGAEALWRAGGVPAGDLAQALAAHHGLPRLDRDAVAALPDLTAGLSRRFLADAFLYPVAGPEGPLLLVADPGNEEAIRAVALALGCAPRLGVLSFEEIGELIARAEGATAAPEARARPAHADLGLTDDVEALQDLARGAPIVRAIDALLERAVEVGATDIHLETGREELRVRLRIDGRLRLHQTLPKDMAPAIISRVKILAGLDIAERRLPQDGRTNVRVRASEADLRVAVMPTLYGETAVLRILVKDARLLDFARVGLSARDRDALERMLGEPHGLIIVTGPTGSGKTTTLATAVSLLNDPARKIVTVEDPIEYQIPGIHQTQIKPGIGLTFANALRSFLRHDPDVIMVGEMRDRETAAIGIQAALTGHLVLTTLHTNSAPDAVIRLADMGVEPYLIAASLRGVVGQRLVRRLCERCRAPDPDGGAALDAVCARRGFARPGGGRVHRPVGCPHCGGSGFRGRVGVFEVMPVDEALTGLIRREPDPLVLLRAAREAGMTTMLEDGLAKAADGLTSLDEVMRMTG